MKFKEESILLEVPISGDIRTTKSHITFNYKGIDIIVPIDFKTDLGSIPQFLQGIFPKDGKAMFGYILHDYLYYSGKYCQQECDNILEIAMNELDVGWWTRKAVRNGLRIGGFIAYLKHRKRNQK